MNDGLDLRRIEAASRFLEGRIRRTPVEESPVLTELLGVPTSLKLENLQVTGSFKIRGAFFRLAGLEPEQAERGVVTCSAGNHGKSLAYAAREMNVAATIFVPKTVDESKLEGMIALGAEVVRTECPGYDDTEVLAKREAERLGKFFVSPFDDWDIMAANGGTLAAEVTEQAPDATNFVLPVGGGGLSAGFSYFVKERIHESRVLACQLRSSPALQMSMERGEAVTRLPAVETRAGGLEGGIGSMTFPILQTRVDHVALIEEEELEQALLWTLRHHQYLAEPTSMVTIAACLFGKIPPLTGSAVVVLSGRNVSHETVSEMMSRQKPMGLSL